LIAPRAQPPISNAISPDAKVFDVPSVMSRNFVFNSGYSIPSFAPGVVPPLAA